MQLRCGRHISTMSPERNTAVPVGKKTDMKRTAVSGPRLPPAVSARDLSTMSPVSKTLSSNRVRSSPRLSKTSTSDEKIGESPPKTDRPSRLSPKVLISPISYQTSGDSGKFRSLKVAISPKSMQNMVPSATSDSIKVGSAKSNEKSATNMNHKSAALHSHVPIIVTKLKKSHRCKSMSGMSPRQKSLLLALETPHVLKRFSAKRHLMSPGAADAADCCQSRKRRSSPQSRGAEHKKLRSDSSLLSPVTLADQSAPLPPPPLLPPTIVISEHIQPTTAVSANDTGPALCGNCTPPARSGTAESADTPDRFSTPLTLSPAAAGATERRHQRASDSCARRVLTRSCNRVNVRHSRLDTCLSAAAASPVVPVKRPLVNHAPTSVLENGAAMTRSRRALQQQQQQALLTARPCATVPVRPVSVAGKGRRAAECVVHLAVKLLLLLLTAALVVSGAAVVCRVTPLSSLAPPVCHTLRHWTLSLSHYMIYRS